MQSLGIHHMMITMIKHSSNRAVCDSKQWLKAAAPCPNATTLASHLRAPGFSFHSQAQWTFLRRFFLNPKFLTAGGISLPQPCMTWTSPRPSPHWVARTDRTQWPGSTLGKGARCAYSWSSRYAGNRPGCSLLEQWLGRQVVLAPVPHDSAKALITQGGITSPLQSLLSVLVSLP